MNNDMIILGNIETHYSSPAQSTRPQAAASARTAALSMLARQLSNTNTYEHEHEHEFEHEHGHAHEHDHRC